MLFHLVLHCQNVLDNLGRSRDGIHCYLSASLVSSSSPFQILNRICIRLELFDCQDTMLALLLLWSDPTYLSHPARKHLVRRPNLQTTIAQKLLVSVTSYSLGRESIASPSEHEEVARRRHFHSIQFSAIADCAHGKCCPVLRGYGAWERIRHRVTCRLHQPLKRCVTSVTCAALTECPILYITFLLGKGRNLVGIMVGFAKQSAW